MYITWMIVLEGYIALSLERISLIYEWDRMYGIAPFAHPFLVLSIYDFLAK